MTRRTSTAAALVGAAIILLLPHVATAGPSGAIELLSRAPGGASGNGLSFRASISQDGSQPVSFSYAPDLVPGNPNHVADSFLRDRRMQSTTLISRAQDGGPANSHSYGPAISRDGRYVVFESPASNIVADDA